MREIKSKSTSENTFDVSRLPHLFLHVFPAHVSGIIIYVMTAVLRSI
jgi:hypothetical protein